MIICSYLCVSFDFMPQILTELESQLTVLSTFTAMHEITLCSQAENNI